MEKHEATKEIQDVDSNRGGGATMVCTDGENFLTFFSLVWLKMLFWALEVGSKTQPKAPWFVKKMKKNIKVLIPTQDAGWQESLFSMQWSKILEDSVYVNKEEPLWLVPTNK